MPIVIPIPLTRPVNLSSCAPKFIETSTGTMMNISMAYECGTYKSGGQYWIWFKIPEYSCSYYMQPFQTQEEAKQKLIEIIGEQKNLDFPFP